MIKNIPVDIKAETLLNYIPRQTRRVELRGAHKRNAYEDISSISEHNGLLTIALTRNGMYDILPESLFHPIDRFDNIPANEYKERFQQEYELQQIEQENARKFFQPYDTFLIELSSVVSNLGNESAYLSVLTDIICDRVPQSYRRNPFIKRAMEFMPHCHRIRGNRRLFFLMLRYILSEEYLSVREHNTTSTFKDNDPRYNCNLEEINISGTHNPQYSEEGYHQEDYYQDGYHQEGLSRKDSAIEESLLESEKEDLFLGNEFEEEVYQYDVNLWKEDYCDEYFLEFVSLIKELEVFLNDFFIGIEERIVFDISTDSLAVRLADDVYYTYLDYNTNL